MKKTILVFFIVCVTVLSAKGQDTPIKDKPKLILSPGISYQGQFLGEINLMYASQYIGHGGNAIWGPRVGIEANINKDRFIYAPKLGFELSGLLIAVRGNVVGYIDDKRLDLRLLSEAGISLLGAVNLTYGYNLPVLNFKSLEIASHRIMLTANVHREIWHAL
ncbi:hypothetical protein [Pontibacter sp. HSC-36F09]|uniref:hypothetical protein n=1 Tax=Pontibacter sp. HSC-36F09 TaxID=2910966 RepID=UPI0020A02379|nr:hypothetical protein [Pontibacter sp. HSC-36F09]MCP2043912.1 hypothetical protein [Pontibacter sp. HSC-36F09]